MVKLYIKTHLDTGLKYFGKTKQNIDNYKGSGKYWALHITKHGYNVKTELYGEFYEDDPLLKEVALDFSKRNDIVESNKWANMMPEDGLSGGATMSGRVFTQEHKDKIATSNRGQKRSESTKLKISESSKGRYWKEETKLAKSEAVKGKKNGMFGTKHSEATRQKMKDAWLKRKAREAIK